MNSPTSNQALKAVTIFFDIGRESFQLPRSIDTYLLNFVNFYSQIKCKLLIVTTAELRTRIGKAIQEFEAPFRTEVEFHIIKFEDLPLFTQIDKFEESINSSAMSFYSLRDRIPTRKSLLKKAFLKIGDKKQTDNVLDHLLLGELTVPEYMEARYLITVLSKPFALQKAYECKFVDLDDPIAFMDFGFGHGISSFLDLVGNKRLVQGSYKYPGILVTKRLPVQLPKMIWDYACLVDDAIIPTGFIVIDHETLKTLVNWWDKTIEKLLSDSIVVDDQTLAALFVANHPSLIQCIETHNNTTDVPIEKWLPIRGFITDAG